MHVCEGAVLGVEVTLEFECQVFQGDMKLYSFTRP